MPPPASCQHEQSPPSLPPELCARLSPHLSRQDVPGGEPFRAISLAGLREAALFLGKPLRKTCVYCLEHGIWPLRFKNNKGWLNAPDQARLLRSHAAVIGCGGLGGHAASLLARLGVGELTLCDHDAFEESNLNRQLFCREDRLGMNKAEAAREELLLTASHLELHVHTRAADAANLPALLKGVDVVLDCLDNLKSRLALERAAHDAGIPFVHGALAGLEGLAAVSFPGRKANLAALYQQTDSAEHGAERLLGVPTPTPAAVALLQALLATRVLLRESREQDDALWHVDLSVPELEHLHW